MSPNRHTHSMYPLLWAVLEWTDELHPGEAEHVAEHLEAVARASEWPRSVCGLLRHVDPAGLEWAQIVGSTERDLDRLVVNLEEYLRDRPWRLAELTELVGWTADRLGESAHDEERHQRLREALDVAGELISTRDLLTTTAADQELHVLEFVHLDLPEVAEEVRA
jgi:hypothetical protein